MEGKKAKNVAAILTTPEELLEKKKKKQLKPREPKYGLPDGFKLIGFDVTA